eukprot:SAG22_NODE_39_length_26283_cov_18.486653_12_plen_82_part_00
MDPENSYVSTLVRAVRGQIISGHRAIAGVDKLLPVQVVYMYMAVYRKDKLKPSALGLWFTEAVGDARLSAPSGMPWATGGE